MKKLVIPIMILIVAFILFSSFKSLNNDSRDFSSTNDIFENINIDGNELSVKYNLGNMIDEEIPYGNKVTKVIDITNDMDKNISFAVSISEVILSDEYLRYNVLYSYEDSGYQNLSDAVSLIGDDNLAYNLVVASKSSLSLKIEFYANNQVDKTKFTGKLSIVSNLSEKDIYRKDILSIQSEIMSNIQALNGINERGYYIVDVSTLSSNISESFKGYVLIDASDYSNPTFNYFVSNGKYILNNFKLVKNEVSKKSILDYDENIFSNFNEEKVCSLFTKKECVDFKDLTFNPSGGKENFYKFSMEVINMVKSDFKGNQKSVYIYDVKEDIENNTNMRGYILIDNTPNNPEYYIYLTNDIYMVTGYNITKFGDFKVNSNTIRSYTDTGFNLSSENMMKVCDFSGFSECVNKVGEKLS